MKDKSSSHNPLFPEELDHAEEKLDSNTDHSNELPISSTLKAESTAGDDGNSDDESIFKGSHTEVGPCFPTLSLTSTSGHCVLRINILESGLLVISLELRPQHLGLRCMRSSTASSASLLAGTIYQQLV